ncbi:MAG: 23S rRNA (adenine(2503)-C(2))-methyltransferase RlmN [Patescibacteria group bacterium]|jgi:23S rRNA (adenine2503-C2)-methyltransferase
MDIKKIQEILKDEPKFRIKQVYEAIFQKFVENWDEVTVLPLALREKLKTEAPLDIEAEIFESTDKKTVKAVISLNRGVIESVLMRHEDRNTVCISSQMGCKMACLFCLTGQGGFTRNLDYYEIVEQVLFFERYLRQNPLEEVDGLVSGRVSNVVFMGMGEPFANYDEVMKAIRFLNDKETFNIGARKISVSTVGLIDGIKKFANEPLQINLALSLHAPNDDIRHLIMPISRNHPLPNLLRVVSDYIKKTNRKAMIEYLLLKDINDDENSAHELAFVLKKYLGRLFVVNLIAYNQTETYKPSSQETAEAFKKVLVEEGLEVVERFRFGRDIKGACGQLRKGK